MARRRKTKSKRRSKKSGVSILGIAETYMLLNVATQTVLGTDPINFVMNRGSGWQKTGDPHGSIITMKELFGMHDNHGQSVTSAMKSNLKSNWAMGIAGMILIPVGFRVGKALARPALSRTNRLLNKSGIGKTVKL